MPDAATQLLRQMDNAVEGLIDYYYYYYYYYY
jgi:hypothetical protein